jgi:branched-chain amino acid aminotransferase
MPPYLFLNQHIVPSNTPLFSAENRAFRYGDAIFESIAVPNKQIPLWTYHYARLQASCAQLYFDLAPIYTADYLYEQIITLCQLNQLPHARVRLSIYRNNGGLYCPTNHEAQILIEANVLSAPYWDNNKPINGLNIGICYSYTKEFSSLSHLKTSNALPYILAATEAQQKGWHDAILLNNKAALVESTNANIWLLQADTLCTPPLTSGCIAGVMRSYLLSHLPKLPYKIVEKPLSVADLAHTQAMWLSNATQGLRWVESCQVANATYRFSHINLPNLSITTKIV